jgi:hypothetical protein
MTADSRRAAGELLSSLSEVFRPEAAVLVFSTSFPPRPFSSRAAGFE